MLARLTSASFAAAAGLGEAPTEPDPDTYEHRNAHCDVLVAGAGPAGLMAALAAARSGAPASSSPMSRSEFGGGFAVRRASETLIEGRAGRETGSPVVLHEALPSLDANVTLLPRSTVFGYYDHNFLAYRPALHGSPWSRMQRRGAARSGLWRVRAQQVVLAQGAFERPLGVLQQRPARRHAGIGRVEHTSSATPSVPGQRAVVFTNNDSAYQTAHRPRTGRRYRCGDRRQPRHRRRRGWWPPRQTKSGHSDDHAAGTW